MRNTHRVLECGIKAEEAGEDVAGLAVMRLVREGGQGRRLQIDLDHVGAPPPGDHGQRGGGLNHRRCSGDKEQIATARGIECRLHGF